MRKEAIVDKPLVPDELVAGEMCRRRRIRPEIVYPNLPINFNDEAEAISGGACTAIRVDGLAIKVFGDYGERAMEIVMSDRNEYLGLAQSRLAEYVPRTDFMIGQGGNGKATEIVLQPWISGRMVGEMSLGEIWRDEKLLLALRKFGWQVILAYGQGIKKIDYSGFALRAGAGLVDWINNISLFAGRNIVWDGANLHLVDVTSHELVRGKRSDLRNVLTRIRTTGVVMRDLVWIEWKLKQLRAGYNGGE